MRKKKANDKAFEKELQIFLSTIGNNLFVLRANRKDSLKTVAKAVKMSPHRLSRIEKGLCLHYGIATLSALARYYKVKVKDIVVKQASLKSKAG